MKKKTLMKYFAATIAATSLLWLGPATYGQSEQAQDRSRAPSSAITRDELARFDQFLDSHRETAEQLRKDPSLVRNGEFLENHPALQTYLQQHPGIREELRENPNAFMRKENRFDRREDARGGDRDRNNTPRDRDTTRGELASFDQFMDQHRETAEQLRKDPSLAKNQGFLNENPDLQTYLQGHPAVREEINENPNAFMRQENRFDRREDARDGDRDRNNTPRDRDTTRGELASFDQFLDHHRETAEQLRKDPSLIKNQEFVQGHPELQAYLQQHQGVREELTENPNVFMRQENRFDRREDARDGDRDRNNASRDRDVTHGELASFDQFLDHHRETAEQLRKDPSLVKNQEFVENHPALQAYLQQHQEVGEELAENPNAFMRQEKLYDRREDNMDRDSRHAHAASFGEFLRGHSEISGQLSKHPSLFKSQEYLENHPELRDYLKANPEVRNELSQNPQEFIRSARQFHAEGYGKGVKSTKPETNPPKQ